MTIDANGCWIWTGSCNNNGYGIIRDHGPHLIHRWVWLRLGGVIPEDMELDHLCRVTACCNPQHLEVVTHQENMRRSSNGYGNRTRCRVGLHDITDPVNVRVYRGRRTCRGCIRDYRLQYQRDYRAKKMTERELELT